ncbi:MAG: GntR family transcriptional regulator [Thermaerobacterales bacterium]
MRHSDRAYDALRLRIITGVMKPGEVILEKDLSDILGVGRTPVREAMQRLVAEGLIEAVPRRGMFVSHVGLRDAKEILEMRRELELISVRYAVDRAQPEKLEQLEAILDRAQETTGEDYFIDVDLEFHRGLAECGNNSHLSLLVSHYYQLTLRLFHLHGRVQENIDKFHGEHAQLVAAVRDKDVAAGMRIMDEHMARARRILFDTGQLPLPVQFD